ncbi:hypothetical protein PsorP6_019497 [Peronosclerospora sorghi]|nr:hypothetical protein PsorP6_019497 [Peronosclerospora sorghi]
MLFPLRSILGVAAIALAHLTTPTAADSPPQKLPWDGRFHNIGNVTTKYLTHILTMRDDGRKGSVDQYVTIENDGRKPGFNQDTGVCNIAVDDTSIFKKQTNFRRSELVQFVETNPNGITFFRVSLKKNKHFDSKFQWQLTFTEQHVFEIRVDATLTPPMIMYLNNGTWDAKWEVEFKPNTWFNFGFAVTPSKPGNSTKVDFYMSQGNAELALIRSDITVKPFLPVEEFHIGALTLSDDGSQPKIKEPEIVSYSGVSVETNVQKN